MGKCKGQIPATLGHKARACDSDAAYRLFVNGQEMGELCGSCADRFEDEMKVVMKAFPGLVKLEPIKAFDPARQI